MSNKPTPPLSDSAREKMTADALKTMKETNWFLIKDLIAHDAKKYRLRYDALVAEGFTEAQSMYLMMQVWQ